MRLSYGLVIKSATDEPDGLRIRGIASTNTPDGLGDVLDSDGAQFTLPMPLLWQHKRGDVVGRVERATVHPNGVIDFEAFLPFVREDGELKRLVDRAIHSVRYGLTRGTSVGFKPLAAHVERLKGGGLKFKKWLWRELSLVDVPENPDTWVTHMRAAQLDDDERPIPPAVVGTETTRRRGTHTGVTTLNIQEHIVALRAKTATGTARMAEILTKAATEGRNTEPAEQEEYDRLVLEDKAIAEDLIRYGQLEQANIRAAATVAPRSPTDPTLHPDTRDPFAGRISVRRNLEKGASFTRFTMALMAARGNPMHALEIARSRYSDTPEVVDVLKAAVDAGTTTDATWAGPLVQYQNMTSEFIELLRPLTIVGRIPGLRRVPFNIRIPRQTAGGTYQWVGQGRPKPVGELAFDSATMDFSKISGIIVLTEELARFSSPDAEATVRADMLAGVAQYKDEQFVDPSVTAVAGISPASVTNGAPTVAATGTDIFALRHDVASLWAQLPANLSRAGGVFITDENTAIGMSMMATDLGARLTQVEAGGGSLFGYPVIVSNSVVHDSGGGTLIFLVPSQILFAEDTIVIDASREASLQMDSAPTHPVTASQVMVSLWQHNMIGLKVEQFVNWQRRQDDVVGYITGAQYGSGAS